MASNKPVKVETPSVKPWVPWESTLGFPFFNRLSRDFDAMFNRFGFERPFFENMPTVWNPEMEIFTKEGNFCVKLDVPGMKKEDITVEVAEDHLVLRGERKQEKEEKKEGFYKTERTYGSFYRAVPLPEGVNPELAKATMHDGVLEVAMPMAKVEEKKRKLEIAEPAATPVNVKAA
jgi:HSP20 family protein